MLYGQEKKLPKDKIDNSSVKFSRYAKLSRINIENPLKTHRCVIWKNESTNQQRQQQNRNHV